MHPNNFLNKKLTFFKTKDTRILFLEEYYTIEVDIIKYYNIIHKWIHLKYFS